MRSTALLRWSLSRSQAATIWQSGRPRKLLVLPGPCMPQPTTPMVMRFEGAAWPKILEGTITGALRASPVTPRKRRRLMVDFKDAFFMFDNGRIGRPLDSRIFAVGRDP